MRAKAIVASFFITIQFLHVSFAARPIKFQWKYIDYTWQGDDKSAAVQQGYYIPESILPTGIARWKDKLFITVPRWKKGVPVSLSYIQVTGAENQTLNPYPSWIDAFVPDDACCIPSNKTVVSAFKPTVDQCNRLWVVDNGVSDMAESVRHMVSPAIVVFDLNTDQLITRYTIPDDKLRENSVLQSIAVECTGVCSCENTMAYISDMGSNALIVYDLKNNDCWRVEHKQFEFDPQAGLYNISGIEFYWSDGVSSVVLRPNNLESYPDLYLHPTSSHKLFRISTQLLRANASEQDLTNAVYVVGDKGEDSQSTALAYDRNYGVFFFTLLSHSGVGCWHECNPFNKDNTPMILHNKEELEFPNDIKTDESGYVWVLSNRQSRFIYNTMSFDDINFRIFGLPVKNLIRNTTCSGCRKCNRDCQLCKTRESVTKIQKSESMLSKFKFRGRSSENSMKAESSSDHADLDAKRSVLSKFLKKIQAKK